MIEINLLPGAQRKSHGHNASSAASAALAGIGERLRDKYLIFGVSAALVGIVAIAGMYLYQSRQQSALDARESTASADSARFAAVLVARARAETARDSVYQQLAIVKDIDDSRYSWPHLLEAINLSVPQYTWLTEITQTSAITSGASLVGDTSAAGRARADSIRSAAKSGGKRAADRMARAHSDSLFKGLANTTSFRVTGQTVDLQALTLFMKNLEASPFIRNVQLTRSDLVTADSKEVTEFQLEAQSEVPPPEAIHTVPLTVAVH